MQHHLLDWRLALDMADLVLGNAMPHDRWFAKAGPLIETFRALCAPLGLAITHRNGGLPAAVCDNRRAFVLSHPLWHTRDGLLNAAQVTAKEALIGEFGSQCVIEFADIREFAARPQNYVVKLAG
jgi:DEAD/DEAH box helicase domain-containing protein